MSDLQGRIIACARDLYLEKGLRGVSMRQVAERLGVSATAIYRHYRNKEDLIDKVVDEAVKVFANHLFTSLTGRTPEERFRQSCGAYLEFALQQSKYYEVIFMSPDHIGEGAAPEDRQRKGSATFQFLVDRVQEMMDSGALRKDDPKGVAVSLWAHSHGLISLYLLGKLDIGDAEFRSLYWESADRLARGMGP